ELLSGRDPANGRQLRAGRRDATAGFDLTFCAPKSVSLLGMLAPREIAHEVVAGHEAAVDDATGFLDRAAIGVRRARGGEQLRLGATGAAAGAFLHRTSRALDPHLHTHLVVANVAHGVDGDWSSLDSRRLFRHSSAIRAVYHARLRAELTARLGVAWDVRPSGMGDVVGVDPVLRGLFSGRSADIAEHLHGRRLSSRAGGARSRRITALVTRPQKDRTRSVDDLVDVWRASALEHGFPPGELTRVVGLGRTGSARLAAPEGLGASRLVDDGLGPDLEQLERRLRTLGRSGRELSRPQVLAEVAASSVRGASSTAIDAFADGLVHAAGSAPASRQGRGQEPGSERRWPGASLADALARVREGALSGRERVPSAPGWEGVALRQAIDRAATVGTRREPGRVVELHQIDLGR
ncbi:MAG TPA: MobF family relaxase, partial [Acidimicrobiales bacterium]|nr:MobF family relaxase [Acidimicrobiales bacterium]